MECDICGRCFNKKTGLIMHIKHEHNSYSYICVCGREFKHESNLKRHIKSYHDKSPVISANTDMLKNISQDRNDRSISRRQTIRKAKQGNKYIKKIIERQDLIQNRIIIKELSIMKCDICDRYFSKKIGLVMHIKHKHNSYSYICVCGRQFTNELNLKRHIKSSHND